MENNVILAKSFTFTNKKLQTATNAIIKATETATKSLFKIALTMKSIKDNELYVDDGFKNISEFAEKVFGYKKTATYNMLKVADEYLNENGISKLAEHTDNGNDFELTQIVEMLPLETVENTIEFVEDGTLKPEMTTKEIRKKVKEIVKGEAETETSETEAETSEVETEYESKIYTLEEVTELLTSFAENDINKKMTITKDESGYKVKFS